MRWWMKVGIVVIICGIILVFAKWHDFILSNLSEKIEIVKYWVQKLGIWAPLAYIFVFALRPLVFLPATPVAILGGLLFGSLWGTVYILAGAMCSSICEFLLVRYFLEEKAKRFLKEKAQALNQLVVKHGFITVFLIRIIPNVAFDLQNCGLALMPIKFTHYFYGTLLGCLPAIIFYACFGNLVLNWSIPWNIGILVTLGVCLYILRFLLPKRTDSAND